MKADAARWISEVDIEKSKARVKGIRGLKHKGVEMQPLPGLSSSPTPIVSKHEVDRRPGVLPRTSSH